MSRSILADDYIAGIVKVCRAVLDADSGGAGITGAILKDRMEHIFMSANFSRSTSRFMPVLPGILAAFAVLTPMGKGLLQAQEPPTNEALYQSGLEAFNTRDYSGAEQTFRRLRAMYPADARAVAGIVEVYMGQKREADAIELLRTEIEKDPQSRDYHLFLGNVLARTGDYGPAISEFQRALDLTSKDSQAASDIYFRMGEVYRRSGNLGEALAQFQRAADTGPGNSDAALQAALVLETTGQTADVAERYRAVLKLDPNNWVALNNLAYRLAEDGGDLDVALEYAQHAREGQPDSEDVADTLGLIYLKKGMPDQAIATLGRAMQKNQRSVPVRSHLAAALDQKRDVAPWMQELRIALRRNYSAENERRITELLQNIGK